MKNRVVKTTAFVLICICTMLFLAGCPNHHDEVISDARYVKFSELVNNGMSKKDANQWLDEHLDEWHPDYKKSDSDKEAETGLPAKKIAGTYEVIGTWTSLHYAFGEPEEKTMSTIVTVKAIDKTELEITLDNMKMDSGSYDPETGKVEFYNKGFGPYLVSFSESSGSIMIEINWDYKTETFESKGTYNGTQRAA